MLTQSIHGDALQFDIKVQLDILAIDRRPGLYHPHNVAGGVHLDFLYADLSMQLLFVITFQTCFTDMRGTAVCRLVYALEFALVDPADIAHDMGCQLSIGVIAAQRDAHVDTLELMAFNRKFCHLLLVESGADGDAFKSALAFFAFVEALSVIITDGDDLCQLLNCLTDIFHLVGIDEKIDAGNVLRQQYPVSIHDLSACRRQRQQSDAVLCREGCIDFVIGDLQPVETHDDQSERQQDKNNGHHYPPDEAAAYHRLLLLGRRDRHDYWM